jgi:hypothetical protein
MSNTPLHEVDTPWSMWKMNLLENLRIACIAASLEAFVFSLFLFLMVQDWHILGAAAGGALVAFCFFNVGISALDAYLKSHPKFAPINSLSDN